MPHPLDGCWAKLHRAKEHADTLRGEIDRHAKEVVVQPRFDPHRGKFALEIVHVPELPIRWGAIIGDALHNFRSALDYLAYEMVRLSRKTYWPDTQFPIVDSPDGYASNRRFQRFMERLTPELRAAVEWAQGYSRGYYHAPRWHILAVLRDLSNIDKHRLLLGTLLASDEHADARVTFQRHIKSIRFSYLVGVPLEPGAALLSADVTLSGPEPEMQVDYNFSPYVSFAIGGNATKILDKMGAFVLETVREIEPFF